MQRDRKSKENYKGRKCKGRKCKVTATGFLVMTTSLPGAGAALPPLDTAGKSGRGKLAGARGCSSPKYTSSGKGDYRPGETVRRQPPPPPRTMSDAGRCMTVRERWENPHSGSSPFLPVHPSPHAPSAVRPQRRPPEPPNGPPLRSSVPPS